MQSHFISILYSKEAFIRVIQHHLIIQCLMAKKTKVNGGQNWQLHWRKRQKYLRVRVVLVAIQTCRVKQNRPILEIEMSQPKPWFRSLIVFIDKCINTNDIDRNAEILHISSFMITETRHTNTAAKPAKGAGKFEEWGHTYRRRILDPKNNIIEDLHKYDSYDMRLVRFVVNFANFVFWGYHVYICCDICGG